MVQQVAASSAGQQVTNINDTDDDDDIEDTDLNDGEEYDDRGHFAESCQSILVCTGVFNSDNDYVRYHGQRPSNHNHRDFVLDAELKQPTYVAEDVLDAVKLVFEKEMYK